MFALILLPLNSRFALYLVLFGILIFSGLGLPVPEEATLILGGYLAYLQFIDFWGAFWVLSFGIVAADLMGYFLGRFAGDWVYGKVSHMRAASILFDSAKVYFEKHGEKMVLFTRPLVSLRVAIPIFAGHFRMNLVKFIIYDILGAIPWTFFLLYLSYYLGSGLELITEVREIKHIMFGIIISLVVVIAVRLIRRTPAQEKVEIE